MVTALLFIILGLIFFHYYSHYGRFGKIVNKIPGPKPIPIFGNALQYILPLDKLFQSQRKINSEYYPITRLWCAYKPLINIFHPDDVQVILTNTKNTEKHLVYRFMHPWLGTGLLTSSGSKWKQRRKILTPAFHFNILEEFLGVFVEKGEDLVNYIKSKENNFVNEDIVPVFKEYTLKIICETAMGTPLEKLGHIDDYSYSIKKLGENIFYRLPQLWFHLDWLFNLSPRGRLQKKCLQTIHDFSTKVINERKKYHSEKAKNERKDVSIIDDEFKDDFCVPKKRKALLDILINAANQNGTIDDEGIREEVNTFIFGVFEGYDTASICLVFAVTLLAENIEIQERARKEVTEILDKSGGKMGMKEINSFSYLERCVKETLRLYPSVGTIGREITEDLQLKNYMVPSGSMVNIIFYDLHRDPNFWPNPKIFDPDRFLPENVASRHPFAYVPFSAGSRNCIGQKFAMLELKVLIAQLLYNFKMKAVDLAHEVVILQDMVITPAHPIHVEFTLIKK